MIPLLLPLCTGPWESLQRWTGMDPPHPPAGDPVGTVELVEDTFPVHEKVSVELIYRPTQTLSPGDIIRVEEPLFHGMRWAKWGYLTTEASRCTPRSETEEASAGFVTASATTGSQLAITHSVNDSEIHEYGYIDIEFVAGGLPAGDELRIQLGVNDGDCGWQTANRAFQDVDLRVFEILGGGEPVLIEPVPTFSFLPEDEVASVKAVLPSQARVGELVPLRVAELDRWGNLAGSGEVTVEEVSFDEPGIYRVSATRGDWTVESNPVQITEEDPPWRIYWGDLHSHHGHSYTDEAGEWVNENHVYARDVMGLDFACESAKSPPHNIDADAVWEIQKRACKEYTADGQYIALLGFEWMGDADQGHHNVYMDGCEGDDGSSEFQGLEDELWPYVESIEAEWGYEVVTIPHASSYTGFNWRSRDDRLRSVAEVYSEWSTSMDESLPGSVPDGLRAGNRMGLIAATDNHDGWMGNGFASKSAPGGLGAIMAEELSATGLIQGMQARRTYATTGERILLEMEVEDGGEIYPMGSEWQISDPILRWSASGTALIERVELRVTGIPSRDPSYVWASWTPGTLDASGESDLPWGRATLVAWLEVTQVDGEKAWSSPVWLNPPALAEPSGCGSGGEAALLLLPLLGGLRRRRALVIGSAMPNR